MKRLEQYDVFDISLDTIFYDSSFNCRGAFTPQSVKELADSIEQHGLQFPVVVQPWTQGKWDFRLLAGHRRFMAARLFLKWSTIPASVRHDLTEHQARLLNLTENLERKDLNMLEEANAIRNLYPEGVSARVAAHELKRPPNWVNVRLRLLTLPEEIQTMVAIGHLSALNVIAILKHETPEAQRKAAEAIFAAKKGRRFLGNDYHRRQPTKSQISQMVTVMLNKGVSGLGPRSLSWAAGYIKDDELLADIEAATRPEVENR